MEKSTTGGRAMGERLLSDTSHSDLYGLDDAADDSHS